MPDIPEQAVDAALAAHIAFQRQARQALWTSPSREQVRAMLEAARPFTDAEVREEIASVVERCGVPGVARLACEEAAAVVRKGQERDDEKEADRG